MAPSQKMQTAISPARTHRSQPSWIVMSDAADDDSGQHSAAVWPLRPPAAAVRVVDHRPLTHRAAIFRESLIGVGIVQADAVKQPKPARQHHATDGTAPNTLSRTEISNSSAPARSPTVENRPTQFPAWARTR